MRAIQARGERKCEVSARKNIVGVAAIHGVSGKNRLVAEVLLAVMAVPAFAIDATHPGNAGTRSQRKLGSSAFDDFSHDLMAGNKTWSKRRKISFDDVKVSAAHSASDDPQQHMSRFELWTRNIFDMKERLGRSAS
jgi:hypothetical protein